MRMRILLTVLLALPVFNKALFADAPPKIAKSAKAQLGDVHFPISCIPSVQQPFNRAVALLHSFAFETAEEEFRKVAQADPGCAMAYWGLAQTYWRWGLPNAAGLKKGWEEVQKAESLHVKTAREREFINALALFYAKPAEDRKDRIDEYSKAMGVLYQHYPNDYEAATFYALSLIEDEPPHDPNYSYRRKAASILEKVFAADSDHPGAAHYLIHAYDEPGLARLGLPAARRYAQIAPAAPHALHMPSHIFARLGLWQEDIASNLASIAASRNADAMDMEDKGHQFHAMDFLVYAYLQCGREAEAKQVIDSVMKLPPMKDMYGMGYDPRPSSFVNLTATYDFELHDWKAAAAFPDVSGITIGDHSVVYLARALGMIHTGNLEGARRDISQFEWVRRILLQQKRDDIANTVAHDRNVAVAWLDHAEGKNDEALRILQEIATNDEGMLDAEAELPPHEMLGDMLMEMKRPEQALTEYETELKLCPKRFDSLDGAGRAAELSGQKQKAANYYMQLLKLCQGSDSTRPELVHARAAVRTEAEGRRSTRSPLPPDAAKLYC